MRPLLIAMLILLACKRSPSGAHKVEVDDHATATAAVGDDLARADALVLVTLYYPKAPTTPPPAAFAALVAAEPGLSLVATPPDQVRAPTAMLIEPDLADAPLPDREILERYFSRGLSAAELDALSPPKAAVILGFAAPSAQAHTQLARAYRLAAALAEGTGAVVWSDDARLMFGAEAWRKRTTAAAGDPPGEDQVITIHAYQPDPQRGLRMVTLGMVQLALPDLVVEDAPRALGRTSNLMIELVAQTLVEGGRPDRAGVLALDVAALRHAGIRERLQGAYMTGATGKATLRLVEVVRDEGDADNRLLRLEPPGTEPYHERLAVASAALFGRTDEISNAKADDPELDAASARARARLPDVARRFAAGLPEHQSLVVKAPFRTTDGDNEYMWIEVRAWTKGTLRGVLTDEPFGVPGLHAGATVEVTQAEVFDYAINSPDGVVEGDETTQILMRRERPD